MKKLLVLFSFLAILTSCQKDEINSSDNNSSTTDNSNESVDYQIKDFIWTGLNKYYLYKSDVPQLADNYFSNSSARKAFYNSYDSPENLFDDLKSSQDRFSFIVDDYEQLEDEFKGITGSTGMKYGYGKISGTNNYFGFIEYILPGSSAEEAGLKRGTIFTEVNGQELTANNLISLLSSETVTINTGEVRDNVIYMSDSTVTITDERYTENPVFIAKTFDIDNKKIGYLMYNSFTGDFDDDLNDAFGDFKADGITDLVLDLRYNGGGDVESAIDLANMITGQFEGQVFVKEQWNDELQSTYTQESLIHRFDSKLRSGSTINSLNLNKVYILTTRATASASELVINGLNPYIDVVQIGTHTVGKFQASITLYDSPDLVNKDGINSKHDYAMQPLVLKMKNSVGNTDYVNGLNPDITYEEDLGNMGTLGEESEPLLNLALNEITGGAVNNASVKRDRNRDMKIIGQGDMAKITYQTMYINKLNK